jgi:hypothetical protein
MPSLQQLQLLLSLAVLNLAHSDQHCELHYCCILPLLLLLLLLLPAYVAAS